MGDSDESELVEASRSGDPVAFRAVVDRYKNGVLGVAVSLVRDLDDAEDVAQQTFVEAYQRLGELRDGARLGGWLRSIAHNRAVDLLRGRQRELAAIEAMAAPAMPQTPQDELADREENHRVWKAVHRLRKPQRETLILHYLSGFTLAEVAAILGVPVGTVKSRLSKARERLKRVTVSQVEGVMKRQSVSSDFSDRVFQLLRLYPERGRMYDPSVGEPLKQVEPAAAKAGFLRALAVPHCRAPDMGMIRLRFLCTFRRGFRKMEYGNATISGRTPTGCSYRQPAPGRAHRGRAAGGL